MPFTDHLGWGIGAAALAPAYLLLWLAVAADKRAESPVDVAVAVALGIAGLLLLRWVRLPFEPIGHVASDPMVRLFLRMLFAVAVPEELVKIAGITLMAWRARAFQEPMDGIVYGAAVGLGFATWENLGYLARHPDELAWVGIARGLLSVPFHAALGAISGACIGGARLGTALGGHAPPVRFRRLRFYGGAFVLPVILHWLYDFCLLEPRYAPGGEAWHALFPLAGIFIAGAAVGIAVTIGRRMARHQMPHHGNRELAANRQTLWAEFLTGCAAALAGFAFLAAIARQGLQAARIEPVSAVLALVLLAGAGILMARTRQRLAGRRPLSRKV